MDTNKHLQAQQNEGTNPHYNKRRYYIIFDKNSGKIKSISNTSKEVTDPENYMQTESWNPVCKRITKGKASLKRYGMIWDLVNEVWDIDFRSTTLIIEAKHNKLIPFKHGADPTGTEIFAKVFYEDAKILIEANKRNISGLKNLSDITEIATSENKLLDIYVTRKNDPDYLISSIEIDPLTLFKHGKQLLDLPTAINEMADWGNISLYAKTVFNNYGWSLAKRIIKTQDFLGTKKILQQNISDKSNININVVDGVAYIHSDIKDTELYYFNGRKHLKFVVCDSNIDNLVGAFEVPVGSLLQEDSKINLSFKWPENPLVVYKNNYITVNTTNNGVTHEQNG
jgi:hypothetical protein